jgi:hypothetical protein
VSDDTRALTSAAIALAILAKKIAAAQADVRERLTMALKRGDRKAGYAGSTKIGAATLTDPKDTWRIVERAKFTDWVRANRPEEIHTIEAVNAAFEKAVLDQGGFVNAETGEVEPVPGIEYLPAVPVLQIRTEKDAETAILNALDDEGLFVRDLLGLLTSAKEIGQ